MNNLKKVNFFLLLLGLKNMQAVEIDSNVIRWTENNAAKIAKRIAKDSGFFNQRDKILSTDLSLAKVMDAEEYMNFLNATNGSKEGKAYIFGVIQAELDQSKLGFSGQSIAMDNDKFLQQEAEQRQEKLLPLWVRKNLNKLIKYFSAQAIIPTSFDEIVKACQVLKIVLPSPLNSIEEAYLYEEIVAGLQLSDMSEMELDNRLGKVFDQKQLDYLTEYLIPKIIAADIKSVTIASLIKYLENLPNKGFVGQKFLNNLIKSHIKMQMVVVEVINDYLTKVKTLLNIVEVVKQLQDLKVNFDRLQKIDQQQQLARIIEVVRLLVSSENKSLIEPVRARRISLEDLDNKVEESLKTIRNQ